MFQPRFFSVLRPHQNPHRLGLNSIPSVPFVSIGEAYANVYAICTRNLFFAWSLYFGLVASAALFGHCGEVNPATGVYWPAQWVQVLLPHSTIEVPYYISARFTQKPSGKKPPWLCSRISQSGGNRFPSTLYLGRMVQDKWAKSFLRKISKKQL